MWTCGYYIFNIDVKALQHMLKRMITFHSVIICTMNIWLVRKRNSQTVTINSHCKEFTGMAVATVLMNTLPRLSIETPRRISKNKLFFSSLTWGCGYRVIFLFVIYCLLLFCFLSWTGAYWLSMQKYSESGHSVWFFTFIFWHPD